LNSIIINHESRKTYVQFWRVRKDEIKVERLIEAAVVDTPSSTRSLSYKTQVLIFL